MDNELPSSMSAPTRDAPLGYARYRNRAALLASSPKEIGKLATRAAQKLAGTSNLKIETVRGELAALVALLRAYASGAYREVSTRTLVAIAAAVLYFVVPLDLVPDFLLGIGFLDDVTVIGYVLSLVRDEVDKFIAWQGTREAEDD